MKYKKRENRKGSEYKEKEKLRRGKEDGKKQVRASNLEIPLKL
jgi:hypothetical protein